MTLKTIYYNSIQFGSKNNLYLKSKTIPTKIS